MLKRVLAAGTALVALAAAANAADLPSRAPPPYVAVPVFTWTGFYIGANAGYAFSDDSRFTTTGLNGTVAGPGTLFNTINNIRTNAGRLDPEGFTGGGQVGYNYQIGSVVIGLEADAAYTDLVQTRTFIGTTGAPSVYRTDLGFLGTVRGRVGYAFDKLLVYGTGGLAYGDLQHTQLFYAPTAAGGFNVLQFTGRRSNIETGWTAGGGVEYALPTNFSLFGSSAVTVKAEALYYELDRNTVFTNGILAANAGTGYVTRHDTNGVVARAGVNFKFGSF